MKHHYIFVAAGLLCLQGLNALADDHPAATSTTSNSSASSKTVSVTPTRKPARPASTSAAPATKTGNDRLDLDTTTVSGNRDLPKVRYIVPWKKADVGNLPGQPFNTLLDEALTPVDREVFRCEVDYYQAVSNKDQPGKGYAGARNSGQSATQSEGK
ncbi:MAG: hypothetical protein ABUL58_00330 [Steroidobacter sp.]